MTPALKLLRELIALPSVNPAFVAADDPRRGEARVAEFLVATAASGGLGVEFQPVLPSRANVLARLTPSGPVRRRLLLAPHMDTVGATGAEDGLFTPRLVRGRLYGRGACDTKGSVAAMLTALLAVARQGTRPRETEIVLAALVDEENGQAGSRALAQSGLRADLAVVGEPTRLQVVTAHKGDLWLRLETRGRAAHGATPHLGRSAVREMARVVESLEGGYAARIARRRHPLLGTPTVNVGTIHGGTQPNVVPAECRISIDRRTLPGETEASVRRELRAELDRCGLKARLVNLRAASCPAMETDSRLVWVRRFLELARQPRPAGVHYFCDAAILAQAGIPSVVFGPGDIAQAHTAEEWIACASLEAGTRLLERFLRSLP